MEPLRQQKNFNISPLIKQTIQLLLLCHINSNSNIWQSIKLFYVTHLIFHFYLTTDLQIEISSQYSALSCANLSFQGQRRTQTTDDTVSKRIEEFSRLDFCSFAPFCFLRLGWYQLTLILERLQLVCLCFLTLWLVRELLQLLNFIHTLTRCSFLLPACGLIKCSNLISLYSDCLDDD